MTGLERTGRHGLPLHPPQVEEIHDGALRVLARTGVVVHDPAVLSLLEGAGCPVDDEGRARLPAGLVAEALALAPPAVTLYNRLGEPAMALGGGRLHARTSSGATGVLDLESGLRRQPTCRDAAEAVRLADALPHLHGVSVMAVQPADVPVTAVELCALRIALENTVKPLGYLCLNPDLIQSALSMAAAVVGGERALQERPFLTALAESTSPLQLVPSQLAVLTAFARRSLPLTLHAHPIAGLTSPVTLAGALAITHAEVLALLTVAQLVRPGTPVIYGMSSSVPDMRSAMNLSGAAEIGLLGAAVVQLARHCGLPCLVSTGTDAHVPGAQSVLERLMTLLPPALAGVDLVNLTTLGTKMTFSLEQLVMDEAILGLVGRTLQGISVTEETLALDLIQEVGPGGAYVASDHTVRRFRGELFVPDLVTRGTREAWEAAGGPDMRARAREKARRLLAQHRPVPLSAGVLAQLDEIQEAAEA
jgi:trimethylamine--corrinoid protein Co-methyltransferase